MLFLIMELSERIQGTFAPYQRNMTCEDGIKNPRRKMRRRQILIQKGNANYNIGEKVIQVKPSKKINLAKNDVRVGDYILHECQTANKPPKAVHISTGEEYFCSVVEKSGYHEALAPYMLINTSEHINNVVDILHCRQKVYFIFERSFGDLHSYVRSKRRLKEDEASQLFKQIVQAVCQCHDSGLAIRDLKLRKFVFKDIQRTQLKLVSLESAHVMKSSSDDVLHSKHGCPAYVGPEILECTDDGYSAKAADMWSLGVIIFTMLSGRYPFHEEDPATLFAKIKSGHYHIPDFISGTGRCLIQSILRKNPVERLAAEELLEHPWFSSHFDSLLATPQFSTDRAKLDQCVPEVSVARTSTVPILIPR